MSDHYDNFSFKQYDGNNNITTTTTTGHRILPSEATKPDLENEFPERIKIMKRENGAVYKKELGDKVDLKVDEAKKLQYPLMVGGDFSNINYEASYDLGDEAVFVLTTQSIKGALETKTSNNNILEVKTANSENGTVTFSNLDKNAKNIVYFVRSSASDIRVSTVEKSSFNMHETQNGETVKVEPDKRDDMPDYAEQGSLLGQMKNLEDQSKTDVKSLKEVADLTLDIILLHHDLCQKVENHVNALVGTIYPNNSRLSQSDIENAPGTDSFSRLYPEGYTDFKPKHKNKDFMKGNFQVDNGGEYSELQNLKNQWPSISSADDESIGSGDGSTSLFSGEFNNDYIEENTVALNAQSTVIQSNEATGDGSTDSYSDSLNNDSIVENTVTIKAKSKLLQSVVGTADGSTEQYTGSINNDLVPNSIEFTDGEQIVNDDGNGNLTGDVDSNGNNNINYNKGDYEFTFQNEPDDGDDIVADFKYMMTVSDDGSGNLTDDIDSNDTNTIDYSTGSYDFTFQNIVGDSENVEINYRYKMSVSDDGSGNLTGDVNSGGNNNFEYLDGTYNLTFKDDVQSNETILADYDYRNSVKVHNETIQEDVRYSKDSKVQERIDEIEAIINGGTLQTGDSTDGFNGSSDVQELFNKRYFWIDQNANRKSGFRTKQLNKDKGSGQSKDKEDNAKKIGEEIGF